MALQKDVFQFGIATVNAGSIHDVVSRPPFLHERYLPPEDQSFQTVVSLILIDYSTTEAGKITPNTLVLAGVRNPETNKTHPNVISTPTFRVFPEVLETALAGVKPEEIIESLEGERARLTVHWDTNGTDHNAQVAAGYLARSLMRAKLGVGAALKTNQLTIVSTEPKVSIFGPVYGGNPSAPTQEEYTHMAGIVTMVTFGDNPFPPETAEYEFLKFMDIRTFSDMVITKNPDSIDFFGGRGSFMQLCIQGLCVRTASELYYYSQRQKEDF